MVYHSFINLLISCYNTAWARDEPPSPKEPALSPKEGPHVDETRASDVGSFQSDPSEGTSRWWTFTLPRTSRHQQQESLNLLPTSSKSERRGFRDISLPWMLTSSASQREVSTVLRRDKEKESNCDSPHLTMTMPAPPPAPYTLAHTNTPGWDTPWTSRPAAQGPARVDREDSYGFEEDHGSDSPSSDKDLSGWALRRKQIRSFILVNTYVPLVRQPFS